MTRLVTVVVLAAMAATILAEDVKPKDPAQTQATPKKAYLPGIYGQMAKSCQLTEEQTQKLSAVLEARKAALDPLEQQVKQAGEAAKAARGGTDKEAMAAADKAFAEARNSLAEAEKKYYAEALAILTPEQQAQWRQYQTILLVRSRFHKTKLSDAQVEQIKAAYAELFKDVQADDTTAREAAFKALVEKVEKDILTAEQREALAKPPASNPAKVPAGEKPVAPASAPAKN